MVAVAVVSSQDLQLMEVQVVVVDPEEEQDQQAEVLELLIKDITVELDSFTQTIQAVAVLVVVVLAVLEAMQLPMVKEMVELEYQVLYQEVLFLMLVVVAVVPQ
jgi:hypothetical protein